VVVRSRKSPSSRVKAVRKGSDASFVRCACGQCQNDASKSALGVRVQYGPIRVDGVDYPGRDYVVPVCLRCQVSARLITKTPLVAYTPPPVSERGPGGGENDMVMVAGKLRQRRKPKTVRVKVA
jgi:hypothetical protein